MYTGPFSGQTGKAEHHTLDVESGLTVFRVFIRPTDRTNCYIFMQLSTNLPLKAKPFLYLLSIWTAFALKRLETIKHWSFEWLQDTNIWNLLERNISVHKGPPFVHNTKQSNRAYIFTLLRDHQATRVFVSPLSALETKDPFHET